MTKQHAQHPTMAGESWKDIISQTSIDQMLDDCPYVEDFFSFRGLPLPSGHLSVQAYLDLLDEDTLQDKGMDRSEFLQQFSSFMTHMAEMAVPPALEIHSLTINGGVDKNGAAEGVTFTIRPGEIFSIVGSTGSGKSRLLADIEWLAQGDTPTKRQILINKAIPDERYRFQIEHKLVAQLSQNMNFVMDLTVREFVTMHAESRMVQNPADVAQTVIAWANDLAGEPFFSETPITALSGGQSRALMIADTACLSGAPIVLIDEIENAGIDRRKALRLMADKRKIVFMATHDPILALMGDKRLVMKNGGMERMIQRTEKEEANLKALEKLDTKLSAIRSALRNGELISRDLSEYGLEAVDREKDP